MFVGKRNMRNFLLLLSLALAARSAVAGPMVKEEEEEENVLLGWEPFHEKDYMGQGIPLVHCRSK